ncbi:hypothetical protein ACQCLI_12860 [Pseudomonas nitroreducens]|uniref:hypothetical protein n=1 Tax=Pseudomonas nitroreducens TaxID=46680 RepID=UPI000368F122|nr:hypothetical protein [Pseudomonas nitroreducens]
MRNVILGAVLLLVGLNASADDVTLFQGYKYGAAKSTFTSESGFYDCSKSLHADAKCLEQVDFAGDKYFLSLIFESSKLESVVLTSPYSSDAYYKLIGLLSEKYMAILLKDRDTEFDVVRSYAENPVGLSDEIFKYQRVGMSTGQVTLYMFEGADSYMKGKSSAQQVLNALPRDTRMAKVNRTRGPESDYFFVTFAVPKLSGKDL